MDLRDAVLAGIIGVAALGPCLPLSAQDASGIPSGARVRVTAATQPEPPYIGTLVRMGDGALVVRQDSAHLRTFSLDSVRSLEVSRGRRSPSRAFQVIGVLLGGVAGVAIGESSPPKGHGCGLLDVGCEIENVSARVGWDALTCAGGMLAGGLIGAAIGSALGHEAWESIPTSSPRPVVTPASNGRALLGLSIAL